MEHEMDLLKAVLEIHMDKYGPDTYRAIALMVNGDDTRAGAILRRIIKEEPCNGYD